MRGMKRALLRLSLVAIATVLAFLCGEIGMRVLKRPANQGEQYYADSEYREINTDTPTLEDLARAAEVLEVVKDAPRFRQTFKPNTVVHVCYRGFQGHDGFDEHGCVEMRTDSWGVREREELCTKKPAGQVRVLCLGDSTTVGWGVRFEDCWTRRAEDILRKTDDQVRMVNCGASGTLVPDEYAHALFTRFARFEPDCVLVTLCLNDLLPVNGGMSHLDTAAMADRNDRLPAPFDRSVLLTSLYHALHDRDPLVLDPDHDWVHDLLVLPTESYPNGARQMGRIYWDSGVPQDALRRMRDWCRERHLGFGVALWPFLQQLGDRAHHPFAPINDQVAAFCKSEGMPFLDLLDVFLGLDPRTLWVSPLDMHGNPRAHALAAPRYAAFVQGLLAR